MQKQKVKFDKKQHFILLSDKIQFQQLNATYSIFPLPKGRNEREQNISQSDDIIIPKCYIVEEAKAKKETAKITAQYIRSKEHLRLPDHCNYQLTQIDYEFIHAHESQFKCKGQIVLTQSFLKQLIVRLEQRIGKVNSFKGKDQLVNIIQTNFKSLLEMPNIDKFINCLHCYWQSQRKERHFPLYRPLWNPIPSVLPSISAFQHRKKETRILRRNATKILEQEITAELYQQFQLAHKIVNRLAVREKLRLQFHELQMINFMTECQLYLDEENQSHKNLENDSKQDSQYTDKQNGIPKQKQRANINTLNNLNIKNNQNSIINPIEISQNHDGLLPEKITETSYQSTITIQPQGYLQSQLISQEQGSKKKQKTSIHIPFQQKKYNNQHSYFSSSDKREQLLLHSFERSQDELITYLRSNQLQNKRTQISCFYFEADDDDIQQEMSKHISSNFNRILHQTSAVN